MSYEPKGAGYEPTMYNTMPGAYPVYPAIPSVPPPPPSKKHLHLLLTVSYFYLSWL